MRFFVAALVVTGCAYDHGTVVETDAGDGLGTGSGSGSGSGSVNLACRFPSADLKLCLEFEDRVWDPVQDSSSSKLVVPTSNLQEYLRGSSPAAGLIALTNFRIAETTALDIEPQITIEMWINPGSSQSATLIENDQQYRMFLTSSGQIGCTIDSLTVVSDVTVPDGLDKWSHVACTFDGNDMRVYVNSASDSVKCGHDEEASLSTSGSNGTRIGASFFGALDDIRIYGATLSDTEICAHADRSCALACSGSASGWPDGSWQGGWR